MGLRKLRLLTAGESHGPAVTVILEGLPARLPLSQEKLRHQMMRRQWGYGRGARMKIETDEVEITAGVRFGITIGSPISLVIRNLDFQNWKASMSVWDDAGDAGKTPTCAAGGGDGASSLKRNASTVERFLKAVHRPRPGHADLAGGLKYNEKDLRNILERASARETVARTAAGAVARQLLDQVGIEIASHVLSIGSVQTSIPDPSWDQIAAVQNSERLRCCDSEAEDRMVSTIDRAKSDRETLGGVVEIAARNVPPGLGSHIQWDHKIDGRIAQAMMSIPAVKGVTIGDAFAVAESSGSAAHDEIFHTPERGFFRKTNHAGGTEGGITNGENLRIRIAMKPLSTLMRPLSSVDIGTKQTVEAVVERSDVCAVPAAGVVAEAMLALVLADALLEKFASDSLNEFLASFEHYKKQLASY
jgi:chorismate synthase